MKRIVCISDAHVESQDASVWAVCAHYLASNAHLFDEIWLSGDVGDWDSLSFHETNGQRSFSDDVKQVRSWLQDLRDLCPLAKIRFLEGNHEDRLQRYLKKNAAEMQGITTMQRALDLDSLNIEWVDGHQILRCEKLVVVHGDKVFKQGDGGVNPATKLLKQFACLGSDAIIACGHLHRIDVQTTPVMDGTCMGLSMPTLHSYDASYMPANTGWSVGWTVFDVYPSGSVRHCFMLPVEGVFHHADKKYTAKEGNIRIKMNRKLREASTKKVRNGSEIQADSSV